MRSEPAAGVELLEIRPRLLERAWQEGALIGILCDLGLRSAQIERALQLVDQMLEEIE